jgi:hypothetical protein
MASINKAAPPPHMVHTHIHSTCMHIKRGSWVVYANKKKMGV